MHKDWANKTTVQGLVDGLSANASADTTLKSDIEDVITRARQLERERCAKVFEQKAHDYAREYGHDDMGSLSFGQGIGGEIKMDYYSDLLENASLIRNLGDE